MELTEKQKALGEQLFIACDAFMACLSAENTQMDTNELAEAQPAMFRMLSQSTEIACRSAGIKLDMAANTVHADSSHVERRAKRAHNLEAYAKLRESGVITDEKHEQIAAGVERIIRETA